MTAPVAKSAADDVNRVGQVITIAQWGVAAVVMVGSAMSAWSTFGQLGEHPVIGAVIALGVDLALASALVVNQRLRALGIPNSTWGTALMWLTGLMTLALNAGADVVEQKWALALLHAFPPLLMVVLTEAGSANQLRVLRARRERESAEKAERDAQDAKRRAELDAQQRERERKEIDRAKGALVDASDYHNRATELRRQAELEKRAEQQALRELEALRLERQQRQAAEQAAQEATRNAAKTIAERKPPATARPKPARNPRKNPASAEEIRGWIRAQRADGQAVTTKDVVEFAGVRRGNEARLIKQVEDEIDAELAHLTKAPLT
jgi:hypothetical protein